MTASEKIAPDDPEKTFLSFSDNVNNSEVVTKSIDDENMQTCIEGNMHSKSNITNQEDDEAVVLNSKQKPPRKPRDLNIIGGPLILDTNLVNE